MMSGRRKYRIIQLVALSLGFLDTDHIGALRGHPFEKSLPRGCPDAIGVQRDDAHTVLSPDGWQSVFCQTINCGQA
jgi:hypothetical protein